MVIFPAGLTLTPNSANAFEGSFVLVDGLQRLTAVMRFLKGEITAFGYYYGEFEDKPHDCDFILCINDLPTRALVLQWYLDLNSGGVVHTQEELDRARMLLSLEGK